MWPIHSCASWWINLINLCNRTFQGFDFAPESEIFSNFIYSSLEYQKKLWKEIYLYWYWLFRFLPLRLKTRTYTYPQELRLFFREPQRGCHCENYQQYNAKDCLVNTDILRNRPAFIDYPPAIFKRIVISQTFKHKSRNAVKNTHQGKCHARPGFCELTAPKETKHHTNHNCVSRWNKLRWQNSQTSEFTFGHFITLLVGQQFFRLGLRGNPLRTPVFFPQVQAPPPSKLPAIDLGQSRRSVRVGSSLGILTEPSFRWLSSRA